MSTRVTITNTYYNRTNSTIETVPTPKTLDKEELYDWWEEVVFPLTGDGFGEHEYGAYHAEVTESDMPELVGRWNEWDG